MCNTLGVCGGGGPGVVKVSSDIFFISDFESESSCLKVKKMLITTLLHF
jgi:hypothetical protein